MRGSLARLAARYVALTLAVVLLNFLIPRLLPGDPLAFAPSDGNDSALALPQAERERLRAYYHLDEPLGRQFVAYLSDLARGDLGRSIARAAPVEALIVERLPWTLGLLLVALALAAALGATVGILAGWTHSPGRARLIISAVAALAALPEFLVGIGLLLVFAVGLGWFPLFGGRSVFGGEGWVRTSADVAWHLTLPAITLVLVSASGFALFAHDTTRELRGAPWVTIARAKGLREAAIVGRHVLPNLAEPWLTFTALRLGTVLGGALVVERVFGVPGLGLLGYQAIQARDYPVLQAIFLLASLGALAANLGLDLCALWLGARRGHRRG